MTDFRSRRSGCQIVTMMQAAKPWDRHNRVIRTCIHLHLSTSGRSLRQREMRSILMVVADVLFHEAFQVPLIENNHMIEQISSTAADPAFRDAILPRASETGSFGFDAEALHGSGDIFIEIRGPVENQIPRRGIVGECFPQLLCDPSATRTVGDSPMKNAPPVMRNNEEAVQHTKGQRRHGEKVHRGDDFTMIAQKAAQRFAGSGLLGALRIQRKTVRSETSKPSIVNSPWMGGAPQVGFSATMRKIS
jgi:hypothetical protein